jgi:uncharacterized LabA/DUF88 family protein
MRTNVYVDGYNLYYGCLRGSPYKWLDLRALCGNVLDPIHVIDRIRYFTALTKPTAKNPNQHIRQQAYIRALQAADAKLTVHLGSFQSNPCRRPLADDPGTIVRIIDTKEKGSDVNLAAYLLLDGFKKAYDAAVVVSNDSDLAEPIRLVRQELGLIVGILNPRQHPAVTLKKASPKFHLQITKDHLKASQLHPTIACADGKKVHKPSRW